MTSPVGESAESVPVNSATGVETRTVDELVADTARNEDFLPGTHGASDTGNARRFVELYGDVVRYAQDSRKWYVWEGTHWRPDPGGLAVLGLTAGVVRYIRDVEIAVPGMSEAEIDRRITHAARTESESARQKILKLVPADPRVRVTEQQLDANPWLLVVRNGTVDLRTGVLRESRPSDLCTRRASAEFQPGAACPLWEDHVSLVTGGDAVLAAYLQRACGYALTGLVGEQKFWFLWGDGQNGKNVFVEALLDVLGDYGQVAPPSLLTGGGGQHPTIFADLRGARMVMSDETGHERINDARLKMLTGSTRVKARFTAKDYFTYDSTMKLWVLGNAKPAIRDQSEGTWRRMQLVPFTVKISDEKKKANFIEELRAERAGILNWCLEGLRDWREIGGVGTPSVVSDAVQAYRDEEDEIGQWLEVCCEEASDTEYESVPALYASYTMWAQRNGVRPSDIMKTVTWGRAVTGRTLGKGKIGESTVVSVSGVKTRVRYGVRLIKTMWSV